MIERDGGRVWAIECRLREHPDNADAVGLRALEQAQKGRVKERIIACRTNVPHKLADGTWAVDVAELLNRVGS